MKFTSRVQGKIRGGSAQMTKVSRSNRQFKHEADGFKGEDAVKGSSADIGKGEQQRRQQKEGPSTVLSHGATTTAHWK